MPFKKKASKNEWKYPSDWPPEAYFKYKMDVTEDELFDLKKLIFESAPESKIDNYLCLHPNLLVCALSFVRTGHHGSWVIPQQEIRPSQNMVRYGLKPDYIIGGKNSDGFVWFVLELKGANEKIFSESKKHRCFFSSVANKAVFQAIEYLDYCSESQSYLRDTLRLTGFREPRGLIIMGRDTEFEDNSIRQRLKAAWNRLSGDKLQIRTYDALIREVESIIEFKKSNGLS
jgi:hypothetical protein